MNTYIVIPVYNESKYLSSVLKDIKKAELPTIVVDDGSTDESIKIAKRNKGVHLIRHKVNLGKGAALKTGTLAAFKRGADSVVYMDSDGQHLAKDLEKFVKALKKNDFVIGSRNLSYGVPLSRYIGNKFASVLVSTLYGPYVTDLLCGFRAVNKDVYKKIEWKSMGYGVETEMIVRAALNKVDIKEINVSTKYHEAHKGVTMLDAINILFDVVLWRIESWF